MTSLLIAVKIYDKLSNIYFCSTDIYMNMIFGDKQRTKSLRDSIIVCFRNLRRMKYVPSIAYNQLCYWLDTDYYDGNRVQGLTSLTALKKHNLVYQPYPNHNPDWVVLFSD